MTRVLTWVMLFAAVASAVWQNAVRGEFGLPALTHAVVYEEAGIKELTKSPKLGEIVR